jgi:hypothetical protein
VMFSLSLLGGNPGDQLIFDGDFTLSDFSAHTINGQVLATVIPEPSTGLLAGFGLLFLSAGRRRLRFMGPS